MYERKGGEERETGREKQRVKHFSKHVTMTVDFLMFNKNVFSQMDVFGIQLYIFSFIYLFSEKKTKKHVRFEELKPSSAPHLSYPLHPERATPPSLWARRSSWWRSEMPNKLSEIREGQGMHIQTTLGSLDELDTLRSFPLHKDSVVLCNSLADSLLISSFRVIRAFEPIKRAPLHLRAFPLRTCWTYFK